MLKVILDTNQIVSSVISRLGPSAELFEAWRQGRYIFITSSEMLQEIAQVLYYPHIFQKYNLTKNHIESVLRLIEHEAVVLRGTPLLDVLKDDPDDNKVLSCAVSSQADYIVSGDHHLLDLHFYKNISIVTAREFLRILGTVG